jgi:hypothetical protein
MADLDPTIVAALIGGGAMALAATIAAVGSWINSRQSKATVVAHISDELITQERIAAALERHDTALSTVLDRHGAALDAILEWQGRHEAAHKVATAKHRALRPAASSS